MKIQHDDRREANPVCKARKIWRIEPPLTSKGVRTKKSAP